MPGPARLKMKYTLGAASGTSKGDSAVLGFRFPDARGFEPDAGESYVIQNAGHEAHTLRGIAGWFTGLWRSETGKIYACEADYRIHRKASADPQDPTWHEHRAPCVLGGIWGLADDLVFAWGGLGAREALLRWDGKSWEAIEPPGGPILGMHGSAPDLIYAVGPRGFIARWDGSRWSTIPSPTRTTLSSVCVVSEDEMYACGNGRRLLEGSIHGWSEVLDAPAQLSSVAKWKGEVWIAAPDLGLLKLEGNRLATVKASLRPSRLDARGTLLCSGSDMTADTRDGTTFEAFSLAAFKASAAGRPPLWLAPELRAGFVEDDQSIP